MRIQWLIGGLAGALVAWLLAGAMMTGPHLAPEPPEGRVVFAPNLATYPQGDSSYPRVIRLEAIDGIPEVLLAGFAQRFQGPVSTVPIWRSLDGGATWRHLSTITSHTPGWDLEAPTLYEVPYDGPGLSTGDILAAGTAWQVGDYSAQKIEVFHSQDEGLTWHYLSDCAATADQPNAPGHGLWEPWFLQGADGTVACFISDERPAVSPTNNQVIGHVLSHDGGLTWSQELTVDVGFPDDPLARPGMSTIAALPNGQFLMSYELCRDGVDPDQACQVYVKSSPDGFDWGPASDRGTLVRSRDGNQLLHTPYIAWSPAGGDQGTVVLSAQRVGQGQTGSFSVQPQSGSVLFANQRLGEGLWEEVAAPVQVTPTGGYNPGEPVCPGYSSPLVVSSNGQRLFGLAATLIEGTANQCQIEFGWTTVE